MSFSWELKKKLCAAEPSCPFCIRSELAGIVGFSGDFSESRLKLMTEHDILARRIVSDISDCIGTEPKITGNPIKKILVEDTLLLENLRACLFLEDEQSENEFRDEVLKLDCCRASFVRGAFLSGGCVLDPKSSYHLEFDTKYKKSSGRLCRLLTEIGYPVRETFRKGHYLVYIKDCESIAEILSMMGAGSGALALYTVQVEKEMRNAANRYVNCETANAQKIVAASAKQADAIRLIDKTEGLSSLPDSLREIAELRLLYPEESLQMLGERLSPPIGKSGANHRMNKIMEKAEDIKQRRG